MQTYADEASFAAIGEGFCATSLTVEQWTHGAHFAAAVWLVLRRPDLVPERDMPDMIRRLNESHGGINSDSAGYHETITQASLRGVRAHLKGEPADAPLHAIHARLMAGPLGRSDWLLAHWSRERLFTPEAKARWISPDIAPLNF